MQILSYHVNDTHIGPFSGTSIRQYDVTLNPPPPLYRADIAARLMADEATVPWLTLPQAIRETDELLAGQTGAEAVLLRGLRDYLGRRIEETKAIVG